jgi:hypothetical protein
MLARWSQRNILKARRSLGHKSRAGATWKPVRLGFISSDGFNVCGAVERDSLLWR